MSSPASPNSTGDDAIGKLLAALPPDALVQLRLTLVKEIPSIDSNSMILKRVEDVLVERLADLDRELKELRAAQAAAKPSDGGARDNQETPTTLSVHDVTNAVTESLAESLPEHNERIRQRVAQAKQGVADIASALDGIADDIALEASLRAYFALFGMPFRMSSELEAKYAKLSEKEKTFIENVCANLVSNVIWGVGAVVIAWAAMS
jgi:uncharacterized phage infection (PIP) family protein YhgE